MDRFSQTIRIKISPEMVDAFARLTGDFSSLHTDENFGRRSGFRQRIVHGMLPLLFLGTLPERLAHNCYWSPVTLAARFVKPIVAGDELVLSAQLVNEEALAGSDNNRSKLSYEVRRPGSDTVLTDGSITLACRKNAPDASARVADESKDSLVDDKLEERTLTFEEIDKGDEAQIVYRMLTSHAFQAYELLKAGAGEAFAMPFEEWIARFDIFRLLSATTISTLVGMQMPGRYATFVDFQVEFKDFLQVGLPYQLTGAVTFASSSTDTLVLALDSSGIDGGRHESPILSGKATVKVNSPPKAMPSITSLQRETVDLGLQDKVLLVTGGSRGIGETIAKLFAVHGARVAVNYLRGRQDAERVADEIQEFGGRAFAVQADVRDDSQVSEMVKTVCGRFGTVDVLVNNAVSSYFPANFLELSWTDVQNDVDVILKGAFNCCQAVVPLMIEQGEGKIINMGTVTTDLPPPKQFKYVVVKSALLGLTRSLAIELASHNIQVNAVSPSLVETDLTAFIPKMLIEQMKRNTPMQRNATPLDVARAVLFLASSMSSFTTGQRIMVSGGNPPFL